MSLCEGGTLRDARCHRTWLHGRLSCYPRHGRQPNRGRCDGAASFRASSVAGIFVDHAAPIRSVRRAVNRDKQINHPFSRALMLENWARAAGFAAILTSAVVCTFMWAISYPPPMSGRYADRYVSDRESPTTRPGNHEGQGQGVGSQDATTSNAEGLSEAQRTALSRLNEAANEHSLAVATWVLAFATILLVVTVAAQACLFLWQLGLMREGLDDAKEAAGAAQKSADAAERASKLAEQALVQVEPAFLFNHGLAINSITGTDGHLRAWRFMFNWKNAGCTPARRVLMHTSLHFVDVANALEDPGDLPSDFDFPDTYGFREPTEQVPLSIGPQGEMADNPKVIDIFDLITAYRRKRRIFLYGWAEYCDIFPNTRRHRTEFCFEVIVVANPESDVAGISTFLMSAYGRHNGAEDECYREAGDTARQAPFDSQIWPPPDNGSSAATSISLVE
jgi:hypothetical protein